MRRPLWFGAGFVAGVGATLWTEQRVRRRVRRAVEILSPSVASSELLRSARRAGVRVRDAFDAGRAESRRREGELWSQLDGTEERTEPVEREQREGRDGREGRRRAPRGAAPRPHEDRRQRSLQRERR